MESEKQRYNLVAIGTTGVGKSSLLNMFLETPDAFKVGETSYSETNVTSYKLAEYEKVKLKIIDTQGLSDGGGDTQNMMHIKNMVEKIRECQIIDLFLLCLDGTNPRLSEYTKAVIDLFMKIFPDFLSHTVLIFNKWDTPDEDYKYDLTKDYQTVFEKDYQHKHIPCYFIDSYYNLEMLRANDDGTQSVKLLHENIQKKTLTQIRSLVTYLITKNTYCNVRKIESKPIIPHSKPIKPPEPKFQNETIINQFYNNQNETIDRELLWKVIDKALDTNQFLGYICSSSSTIYMTGIYVRFRGEFSCPGFAPFKGNSKQFKSDIGAREHAADDFMQQCKEAGLLSKNQLENYLGQRSLLSR